MKSLRRVGRALGWPIQGFLRKVVRAIPVLVSALLVAASAAQGADVSLFIKKETRLGMPIGIVLVHGLIEEGDADNVRNALNSANKQGALVWGLGLISPGGKISEGIAIGRLVREYRLPTMAPLKADQGKTASECRRSVALAPDAAFIDLIPGTNACVCASACALAWIGGVGREGTVGLHHHYYPATKAPKDFARMEAGLASWNEKLDAYFKDVRAPEAFRKLWFNTNSSELVFVGWEEDPKIYEFDPLYREFLISRCGPFPPDEARDYQRKQSERLEAHPNNIGAKYALELLSEKLEAFDQCIWHSYKSALLEKQEVKAP